jgi:ribose-phosphate pyrophosphokinase
MELVTKKRLHLVSGRANLPLAEEIAERLGITLGDANLGQFANGELHCRFGESVRGSDVFIMQSHTGTEGMSVNDALMEQLIMVDAAKRASAKRITAVAPFYGYARQDRKSEGREPITAKLVANMFKVASASSASTCTPVRSRASSTGRSTTSRRCRCWSST